MTSILRVALPVPLQTLFDYREGDVAATVGASLAAMPAPTPSPARITRAADELKRALEIEIQRFADDAVDSAQRTALARVRAALS